MRLIELSDAATFLEYSKDFLVAHEGENQLLLSSIITLAKSFAVRSARLRFFVVLNEGRVAGAALNASERRLLISRCSPEIAEFMGRELASRDLKVRGIMGHASSSATFCAGFAGAGFADADFAGAGFADADFAGAGGRFSLRLQQKVMRLDSPLPYETVPGIYRSAKAKDLKLLLGWSLSFVKECGLDERPEETEEIVRRYIENRQLFIWEHDGHAVAMAGYGGITPGGARVNMVYTNPCFRSRGYAGTLVHLLSLRLLSEGHKHCYLFSNALDPVANRIYERLGYRAIGEFAEFRESALDHSVGPQASL